MTNCSPSLIIEKDLSKIPTNTKKAIEMLEGNGAVNFGYILELVEGDMGKLDNITLQRIRNSIIFKIQYITKCGAWSDLYGVQKLLEIFEIEDVKFSDEMIDFIEKMFLKLSYGALSSLSPGLIYEDGKYHLHNILPGKYNDAYGREFHQIPYIRTILLRYDFTEDELTDEYIGKILEIRELLIKMHLDEHDSIKIVESMKKGITGILKLT